MKCRPPTEPHARPAGWRHSAGVFCLAALLSLAGHAVVVGSVVQPRGDTAGRAEGRQVVLTSRLLSAQPAQPPSATPRPPARHDAAQVRRRGSAGTEGQADARPSLRPAYLASRDLDMPPLPRSAPDDEQVVGMQGSGLPIRLRLFIEADGRVSSVTALQAAHADGPLVERLREMFVRTAFIPGRRAGRDVAAFLDIAIEPDPVHAFVQTQAMR